MNAVSGNASADSFRCRFEPSCSQYCFESFSEHHFFKAFVLTLTRISRCHPWSRHPIVDPVPQKKSAFQEKHPLERYLYS